MATITINDYQIGNNIIKDNNTSRILRVLWGDETELVWAGNIYHWTLQVVKNSLKKIFIDVDILKKYSSFGSGLIKCDGGYLIPFYGFSPRCQIFTNATSKPENWDDDWNVYDFDNVTGQRTNCKRLTVHWGATRANYEEYQYV